jgi:hypothetical protein
MTCLLSQAERPIAIAKSHLKLVASNAVKRNIDMGAT